MVDVCPVQPTTRRSIVISNSSLNREGFRVLTTGIELDAFKANPVMRLGHEFSVIPVGRWEELRVEGDELKGVPVFNLNHWLGETLQAAYDDGFINAASGMFNPLEVSMAPEHLLPGQVDSTFTRCELYEASLVEIPANKHAVADKVATLSARSTVALSALREAFGSTEKRTLDVVTLGLSTTPPPPPAPAPAAPVLPRTTTKAPAMNPEQLLVLAAALGLSSTATFEDCTSSIKTLRTAKIDGVVELGVAKGVITDGNREHYAQLAASNPAAARALFASAAAPQPQAPEVATPVVQAPQGASMSKTIEDAKTLAANAAQKPAAAEGREGWGYIDWMQKDSNGLKALKATDPDRFAKLVATLPK